MPDAAPIVELSAGAAVISLLILFVRWVIGRMTVAENDRRARVARLDDAESDRINALEAQRRAEDEVTQERIAALEAKVDLLDAALSEQRSYKHAYRGEAAALRNVIAVLSRLRQSLHSEEFYLAAAELLDLAMKSPSAEERLAAST